MSSPALATGNDALYASVEKPTKCARCNSKGVPFSRTKIGANPNKYHTVCDPCLEAYEIPALGIFYSPYSGVSLYQQVQFGKECHTSSTRFPKLVSQKKSLITL